MEQKTTEFLSNNRSYQKHSLFMEKWHKNCCMCVAGKQQQWHTSRSHRLDYFFQPPSLHPHQRIIQFMLSTSQFTHAKGCLPFWNWSWLLLRVMWGRECTGVISPVQRLISSFSISSFPFGKIIIRVLLVILHIDTKRYIMRQKPLSHSIMLPLGSTPPTLFC